MSSWFAGLMGIFGYTKTSVAEQSRLILEGKLSTQEAQFNRDRETLQQRVRDAQAVSDELSTNASETARLARVAAWQTPAISALPSYPPVPPTFYMNTVQAAGKFAPSLKDPGDLSKSAVFSGSSALRLLYWSLAHAAAAACRSAAQYKSEDGISTAFRMALQSEIGGLRDKEPDVSLKIGINAIYENIKPAIKEARVGADLLLIVSGDELVPGGGARIFWIQAKRGDRQNPYELNYYREPNADGVVQFEALSKVHNPKRGSFSLYWLYAEELSFIPVTSISALKPVDPHLAADCVADLGVVGLRLQELLTSETLQTSMSSGRFQTADELVDFLVEAANNAIVPLEVLSVHGSGERMRHQLVDRVQKHYAELIQERSLRPGKSRPGPSR
jgi:hypothetical protein